jgi:hypothetical protein
VKIDNKPCFLQILSTLYIVNESLGQCHSIFGFINGRLVFDRRVFLWDWDIYAQIRRVCFFCDALNFHLADFPWVLADFFISMADLFPDSAVFLLL